MSGAKAALTSAECQARFRWCVVAALLLNACAPSIVRPPLTLEEAGLTPIRQTTYPARRLSSLDAATEVLLSTIERETGERPVFEEGEAIPDPGEVEAALIARPKGWMQERTSV